jgi:hypothetical protein
MAKDTGQRFAYLVLAELATIHAVVDGIHDYVIADVVARSERPKQEIIQELNTKLKARAKKKLAALLARVELPDLHLR